MFMFVLRVFISEIHFLQRSIALRYLFQVLLQDGADVNATDYNNDTPMSWASMKGNLEVIKILLEYNARVDTENNSGHTPLRR